jgi:hypothetical protein
MTVIEQLVRQVRENLATSPKGVLDAPRVKDAPATRRTVC